MIFKNCNELILNGTRYSLENLKTLEADNKAWIVQIKSLVKVFAVNYEENVKKNLVSNFDWKYNFFNFIRKDNMFINEKDLSVKTALDVNKNINAYVNKTFNFLTAEKKEHFALIFCYLSTIKCDASAHRKSSGCAFETVEDYVENKVMSSLSNAFLNVCQYKKESKRNDCSFASV